MKWYFYHNRRLRKWANRLVLKMTSRELQPADAFEEKLIAQLRSDFNCIGKVSAQASQPSEKVWMNNMNRLMELVVSEDPRKFLHWDVIQKAMFITNAMYILMELSFLKKQNNWSERWKSAICEDKAGTPIPYWRYPSSSGNLIHHAYHIAQLEAKMGFDVSTLDYVVECGGGYGSMCRLFRDLGFTGTYIIFDLPHFSALQKYFLRSVGINVSDMATAEGMTVQLTTDLAELGDLTRQIGGKNAMFLGTWSLSEMPLELRKSLTPLFTQFKMLFFAYQSCFEEVDNVKYFQEIKDTEEQFSWKKWEVDSLPTNFYLAGKSG